MFGIQYIRMQFTVKREYAILLQPMRMRMCVNCTYENKRDENRKSILIKMFTWSFSFNCSRFSISQSLNHFTLGKKNNYINDLQYRILRWISRWLEMDELLFNWEPELHSNSFFLRFGFAANRKTATGHLDSGESTLATAKPNLDWWLLLCCYIAVTVYKSLN